MAMNNEGSKYKKTDPLSCSCADRNKSTLQSHFIVSISLANKLRITFTWDDEQGVKKFIKVSSLLEMRESTTNSHVLFYSHSAHKPVILFPFILCCAFTPVIFSCYYRNWNVLPLTRNWAMSKAKSWTKLNRCLANGATRPGQDFGSSGASEVFLVAEHKVTNTTSQQSWATKWNREWQKKKKVRGENKEGWQRTGPWRTKMLCPALKSITFRSEHSTLCWKMAF